MDLDTAISKYGTAQMKLEQLQKGGIMEAIREKKDKLNHDKQRLCQYLVQHQLTCVPFFTKDQKQPMYLRLQQKVTYRNITADALHQVVTKAITRETLQQCATEFLAEQTPPPPASTSRKKKTPPEPKLPTWSDVIADAIHQVVDEDFTVTKVTAGISKTKQKGFKADSPDATLLPVEVLKIAVDVNSTDQAIKTMTKMKNAKKRKYEEIKAEVMPVIAQHLQDPAIKRECEVRGLDGRTKTYEIKAVAKPDKKKTLAATTTSSSSDDQNAGNGSSTKKNTAAGISAKALQDDVLGVIEEHPVWSARPFAIDAPQPSDQELKEIQKQVYDILLEELQVLSAEKMAKKAATAAKKKQGTTTAEDGTVIPPVVIKMQLKRAKVAGHPSDDDDDDDDDDDEEQEEEEEVHE